MRYETHSRNQSDAQVGLSGLCWYRSTDTNVPGCGIPKRPMCDVQRIGQRESPIAGQAVWTMTLAPIRTNYFQIFAYANHVVDTTNPSTNLRLEYQVVRINSVDQEPFSNATAALANTSAVLSDDYEVPPAGSGTNLTGAIPVAWGIVSQTALLNVLTLSGVSRYAANVSADLYAAAFGNGLDILPPGYSVGRPFHM